MRVLPRGSRLAHGRPGLLCPARDARHRLVGDAGPTRQAADRTTGRRTNAAEAFPGTGMVQKLARMNMTQIRSSVYKCRPPRRSRSGFWYVFASFGAMALFILAVAGAGRWGY